MEIRHAVGDTIRKIRQEQGLALRDVSPYISIGHLSEIERGKKEASGQMLESISQGLQISTAELFREIAEYLDKWNKGEIHD